MFRHYEKLIIKALQGIQGHVIATGGGVILDEENRKILKKLGEVIYIQVAKEVLKERLKRSPPLILDPQDFEGSFEKMYREREPLYTSLADRIYIDTCESRS
jgi:shikimate kinase